MQPTVKRVSEARTSRGVSRGVRFSRKTLLDATLASDSEAMASAMATETETTCDVTFAPAKLFRYKKPVAYETVPPAAAAAAVVNFVAQSVAGPDATAKQRDELEHMQDIMDKTKCQNRPLLKRLPGFLRELGVRTATKTHLSGVSADRAAIKAEFAELQAYIQWVAARWQTDGGLHASTAADILLAACEELDGLHRSVSASPGSVWRKNTIAALTASRRAAVAAAADAAASVLEA